MLATETAIAAHENILRWRANTKAFAYEVLHFEPDAWQAELFDAFDDPKKPRISLQACAGPGKTAGLAICGWKFLACYGDLGEHPKGAAVAVDWTNLRDNLWPELAKWQQRSEFLKSAFTWTRERIFANDHPETWFLSARTWPKTANPEEQGKTLSGLHSRYVLALIDESGAIPETVLRAAEQALSTNPTFGKILQAGNPLSIDGMLYAAATRLAGQWHVIRITGDPDDPRRSPRIDLAWAKQQIQAYGRDNPWVKSYILGEFPPSSLNTLLGIEDVQRAMERTIQPSEFEHMQKRIGADVARFGDDRTVLAPRQGLMWFPPVVMRHERDSAVSTTIATRIIDGFHKWNAEVILIDGTGGWGAGTIDSLRTFGLAPMDIQFHAPANDPRFKNRRAEMWWNMAQAVKSGAALPNIGELRRELSTPQYLFHNGKFQLEEKDQIKKRLGSSPDLADAYAVTFAIPEMPSMRHPMAGLQGQAKAVTEYDFEARLRA